MISQENNCQFCGHLFSGKICPHNLEIKFADGGWLFYNNNTNITVVPPSIILLRHLHSPGTYDFMLIATHITFVFLVPIMLLNFLIGLMSSEVAEHLKNRELGVCLTRVAAASVVERRLSLVAGFFYNCYRNKFFFVTNERVYVQCLVDVWCVLCCLNAGPSQRMGMLVE